MRVRAGQRLTIALRQAAAALAVLAVQYSFLVTGSQGSPTQAGRTAFDLLVWLGFGFCLLEGTRQSADVISQEKRQGTLGLLFLTRLSGFDVVAGKLMAATLHSLYGLLATVPVVGLTLVLGGVTGGEFCRTQLALVNTLFVASTAALWTSSRSQGEVRALLGAFGLTVGLSLLPLLIQAVAPGGTLPSLSPAAGLWFALDATYVISPIRFWLTQAILLAMSALFLMSAGRITAAGWRQASPVGAERSATPGNRGGPGANTRRVHGRRRSRGSLALATWCPPVEQRGLTALAWFGLLLPPAGLITVQMGLPRLDLRVIPGGAWSLRLLLDVLSVLLLAVTAARPVAQAKADGSLELLLCTPMASRELVGVTWRAYWRRLRTPLMLYALMPIAQYFHWAARTPAGGALLWRSLLLGYAPFLVGEIVRVIAIGWLGIWFGVAARSLGQALGRTLLVALLIPWSLTSLILWSLATGPRSTVAWFGACLASVAWLLGSVAWARTRTRTGFRQAVASDLQPPRWALWWIRSGAMKPS